MSMENLSDAERAYLAEKHLQEDAEDRMPDKQGKKDIGCKHEDCRYRATYTTLSYDGRCDYIGITGHSRILWHRRRKLSEKPCDCRLYEPGKRVGKRKELPATTPKADDVYTTGKLKFPRSAIKEAKKGMKE